MGIVPGWKSGRGNGEGRGRWKSTKVGSQSLELGILVPGGFREEDVVVIRLCMTRGGGRDL